MPTKGSLHQQQQCRALPCRAVPPLDSCRDFWYNFTYNDSFSNQNPFRAPNSLISILTGHCILCFAAQQQTMQSKSIFHAGRPSYPLGVNNTTATNCIELFRHFWVEGALRVEHVRSTASALVHFGVHLGQFICSQTHSQSASPALCVEATIHYCKLNKQAQNSCQTKKKENSKTK